MHFQIEVSKMVDKKKVNSIRLRPRLDIYGASYWQKRLKSLSPNNRINVVIANRSV